MATSAAKKTGARGNSPKKRAPKEVNLLDAVSVAAAQEDSDSAEIIEKAKDLPSPDDLNKPKSLYPEGVQVFSYQPKEGGEPILLAINGFEPPTKLWLFDIAQLPILSQTWAWLDKANVPKEIQRQCMQLPDDEYFDMYHEWFEVMRIARGAPGPKGAVTPAK